MKRLASLAVSLIILAVIYWKIDFRGFIQVFRNSNVWWIIISLGMVVPITLLTAWRLQQLMPHRASLGFGEANRLILVANMLNMVLPSKMGDIAKAYFIKERGYLDGQLSLSVVVFEKVCDMFSLFLWCVFGLILYPKNNWLFWALTVGVVFGLGFGFLLISSRKFARIFFVCGNT